MQMNADDKIKVKTQNVVKFPVQSTCRIPDKMPEDKMPENEKLDKMTDNPYPNPYPRPQPNRSWSSSLSLYLSTHTPSFLHT